MLVLLDYIRHSVSSLIASKETMRKQISPQKVAVEFLLFYPKLYGATEAHQCQFSVMFPKQGYGVLVSGGRLRQPSSGLGAALR